MAAKRRCGGFSKAAPLQRVVRQTPFRDMQPAHRDMRSNSAQSVLLQCDTLQTVMSFLAASELAACSGVCSTWRGVASSATLWQPHCQALWQDKLYVPAKQLIQSGSLTHAQAYAQSLRDAQRQRITAKDLCAFEWQFRFKRGAGAFFVEHDPFWNGEGPTMKRYFHADGTITAASGDPFFSQHEDRWKFTKTKNGKVGAGQYLKINHWPSLELSRNTADWSMVLQNEWVVYSCTKLLP